MDVLSVAVLGALVSAALSAALSIAILSPTRALLVKACSTGEGVEFWTRFTILMLFLGPLIVTLVFGVPTGSIAEKLTTADAVVRVVTSALVGVFLTLGGIGIRLATLKQVLTPATRTVKSDDQFIR